MIGVTLPIQIAPSVLPVDFSKLGEAVVALDEAGVDLIQWDVMDGQFVPNLTFGPDVIASTRSLTKLPFEAHLMVLTPDVMAKRYVEAGCQRLIVHVEACTHLHRTLGNIRELGARNMIRDAGLDDAVNVEVDGGISNKTISGAAKAGANVLIAGSALFKEPKGLKHAVSELRAAATAAFVG